MTSRPNPAPAHLPELPSAGTAGPRIPLIHTLPASHADYGGERMTLAILEGLSPYFDVQLFADRGLPVHERARAMGIPTKELSGPASLARALMAALLRNRQLAFMTSDIKHSLTMIGLNATLRRRVAHLHLAHGGPEPEAYRRKKLVNHFDSVRIAAVSSYARARLLEAGVHEDRISVIGNFLTPGRLNALSQLSQRRGYQGVKRVVLLSRVEGLKRLDLIFDAIDLEPALRQIEFRVLGDGPLLEEMRRQARAYPNVSFPGFVEDINEELSEAELFLHCCPSEAFGISVLEAMAAGLPVVVPNQGGVRDLVLPGRTGLLFEANNPADMARRLMEQVRATPTHRQAQARAALARLEDEYSASARCLEYRNLIADQLGLSWHSTQASA